MSVVQRNVCQAFPLVFAERHNLNGLCRLCVYLFRILSRNLADVGYVYAAQQPPARAEHPPYLALLESDVLDTPEAGHVAAQVDNQGILLVLVDTGRPSDNLIVQGYGGGGYAEDNAVDARIVEACRKHPHVKNNPYFARFEVVDDVALSAGFISP